jgi:dienelactone hydrolase
LVIELGRRLRKALLFLTLLLGVVTVRAQTTIDRQAVLAPPPKIVFGDWREVDETETATEFLETFPSAFASPYPVNNTVPLRILVPVDATGPVPVVLITHYWGAKDLRAERSLASDLNEKGIAAAILTLPYHLARTPKGYLSGQLAIRPDPQALRETMYQSELDVRRSLDFLDSRPEFRHDHYGITGTSFGAIVAGLSYGLDPRISYAAILLGGADLAKIIWTSSRVLPVREELRRKGWTEAKLRDELAPIEPLNYLPRSVPGQTFVVYGRYDTVVPNDCTEELISKLGSCEHLLLDTGHYGGIMVEGSVLRTVAGFFSTEFSGGSFRAPLRLVAPTIRLGGMFRTPDEFDIGIGVDIIHFDREANTFGSIFASPRGLDLYLGRKIVGGFSLGAVGSTRGLGVGLVWSTVL